MTNKIGVSWKSFLGMVGLVGTLLVIAALTSQPSAGAATAASGKPISGKQATSVAQKTEQLHAAHAKMAAVEDETPLLRTSAQALLSPEQALDLVQKSGLAIGPVSSVDLTTDAGGRSIYEVRSGPLNSGLIQVDAQTGVIVVPGPPAP